MNVNIFLKIIENISHALKHHVKQYSNLITERKKGDTLLQNFIRLHLKTTRFKYLTSNANMMKQRIIHTTQMLGKTVYWPGMKAMKLNVNQNLKSTSVTNNKVTRAGIKSGFSRDRLLPDLIFILS